ncbi:putative membrane protein YfcA [Desulfohalotomaculum tongense]|uniref:sulfite exporter TauE/SafE family protein n=1 Tax=Desulforadius tongensis TaxID=1216062 RepID=UPI00195D22ED|nr:sulfite exporter TauE/SafE family protein [Desulforadius tongensis]MBM7853988.1 putative membrane protein YfcA [Desulforadius tongensis]
MRKLYDAFMEAAAAHAKWDYEVSMNILHNRKKLFLLLLMALPVILPAVAHAASSLPAVLGGKSAYAPSFFSPFVFYVSIAIGLCAGLITGCIGAGGGFIITPALMSAGVKGILAVGTDLFHIFAKAIMGTTVHKKLGNVHVGLAIAFLVGSTAGVTFGGKLNRALYNANPVLSDTVISIVYVVMLGFLGTYALIDFLKSRKRAAASGAVHGGEDEELTVLAKRLQKSSIPPTIKFDQHIVPGGRKISAWFVAVCGAVVGLTAAIMGVGGGFLTFPMFVYGLGVSTATTVGTDILQIIFTAGYASISQYALYGYIFYTLAMGMLIGSLIGIQIGAITTKVVSGSHIKGFYAVAILAGFFNRLMALPGKLNKMEVISISKTTAKVLTNIGNITFFAIVTFFAVWVISKFASNFKQLRKEATLTGVIAGEKGVS